MLKQTRARRSASPKQAVDPVANPEADPVDRAELLKSLGEKFDRQLVEMHSEAREHNAGSVLAYRISLVLAIDIVHYGSGAAGDILKFLGEHILAVNQYRNAEDEAEAAKERGELAH